MNKNFGTITTILLVINIFIGCFVAFYLVGKSNILLENQKSLEALLIGLDEDINEDVHSLMKK